MNEQVRHWNEVLAPKFLRWKHILVDGLTHHSAAVFPRLSVRKGDRVVDVGCGFGDTTIELARLVGPSGHVLGIDCCGAFLEHGREAAAREGMGHLEFIEADVQAYSFAGDFDLCFSRFGVQFFENPVAGFRHLRSALRPSGTLAVIAWRELEENTFFRVPKQVVTRFLPAPDESAGPGPFSMADTELVSRQLGAAGYREIAFERIDAPILVGRSVDEAVAFQLALGPAGGICREAGQLAVERHDAIVAALSEELASHETPEGIVLGSSSWKITARNPE